MEKLPLWPGPKSSHYIIALLICILLIMFFLLLLTGRCVMSGIQSYTPFIVCLLSVGFQSVQVSSNPIDPYYGVGCEMRKYWEFVEKETKYREDGEELFCRGHVKIDICMGSCESTEVRFGMLMASCFNL